MKKIILHSIITLSILSSFFIVHAQDITFKKDPLCGDIVSECCDGKDNQIGDGQDYGFGPGMGDGKADFYGLIGEKDGKTIIYPPDPSCIKPETEIEKADLPVQGSLIPCTNKCSFPDIIKLFNNILTFLITTVFLPLFVLVFMYAGYTYLTAQGNPSKIANVKKLLINVIIGLVIVLTAWLLVRVFFQTIGVTEGLLFLE
jgi:hypothetical protein